MSRLMTAFVVMAMVLVARGPAFAHHSMAVYEIFTTTIEGTVQQFRFVNPHSVIVLKVKTPKGGTVIWHLEGDPPAWLVRDGYSRNLFRSGDRLRLLVHRMRNGKAVGLWTPKMVIMKNGREFVGHQCLSSPDRCNLQ